jgi:hypothetical protein
MDTNHSMLVKESLKGVEKVISYSDDILEYMVES